MYENVALLHVDADTIAAGVTTYDDGDTAFYSLGDDGPDYRGRIMAKPARFGMHPSHGVMLTFGGYSGHIEVGDWAISGTVLASGPDMVPGPHSTTKQYPLGQVRKDDPQTADLVTALVSAIAAHYAASYTGRGLR